MTGFSEFFDPYIFSALTFDGLMSAAVYALLGLALVLVFAVTRVIFIPQGEFVTLSALTLATLQGGDNPGTVWITLAALVLAAILEAWTAARRRDMRRALLILLGAALVGGALYMLTRLIVPLDSAALDVLLTVLLVAPLGPLLYRTVYQPMREASVLTLLIASVALHLVLTGLALGAFGAEGNFALPLIEGFVELGSLSVSYQSLLVMVAALAAMGGLALFFNRTLTGKALRATAVNPLGARLVGIRPARAGLVAFTVAGLLGALCGILVGPSLLIGYDSGFLIGLKGFVAAIIGGLASFPVTVIGAVMVGLVEAYASFGLSQWKEVIVFTLILPVLLWRSFHTRHHEEEE